MCRGWNLVFWSQARPGAAFPWQQHAGTLLALAGSPDSDTRNWSPAISLAPPKCPLTCKMGCGVCLTVTMVGGKMG